MRFWPFLAPFHFQMIINPRSQLFTLVYFDKYYFIISGEVGLCVSENSMLGSAKTRLCSSSMAPFYIQSLPFHHVPIEEFLLLEGRVRVRSTLPLVKKNIIGSICCRTVFSSGSRNSQLLVY